MTMEELKLSASPGISSILTRVSHFLHEEGVQAYLVGGFVRDTLLERDTADIDIAVEADALEIARRVATAIGGKYVLLDEANGTGRVVLMGDSPSESKLELDFSTLKGDIEQDLSQRDFTIDAMAIELGEFVQKNIPLEQRGKLTPGVCGLIDPFGGLDNLHQGVVRATTDTVFQSDPVRLLRAVRLAAELGFSIDRETETLIRRYCPLIATVAAERIREELLRILTIPGSGQILIYLDELGLLTAIIPELAQAKGVEQPTVHFWDVFDHSIQVVNAVDFLLGQGDWKYAGEEVLTAVPWSAELGQHFDREVSSGSTRKSLLKLAALLHDIAKPQTKVTDENGRARFLGHPVEGAPIAVAILKRLRFSTREIKLAELLVKYHLRPGQMSHDELPSRRAIYRYFRDTGEAGIDILFLSLADHLATRGPNLDLTHWQEHTQVVDYVLTRHFEEEILAVPPRIVDGHNLIETLGLSPGPRVGELLEAVREAQATGEVKDREEALAYIDHLLTHSEETRLNRASGEK